MELNLREAQASITYIPHLLDVQSASTWSNIVGGSPHGSELMIQRLGHDVNIQHLDNIAQNSTTSINESAPRMSVQWISTEGGRIEISSERPFEQGRALFEPTSLMEIQAS